MSSSSRPADDPGVAAAAPVLVAAAAPVSSYDAVPYSVSAFPQTRPDRLATLATLFGMSPAPPARCRVLELGCASGGNLIPMALGDPESRFVGIDLSPRQIADGRATAAELGIQNLDLRALSILDFPADLGTFDYILCHGVYSWVPPEVQGKILDICSSHLAPQGVAYVSYNCLPGWHARGAIREMLWYHTSRFQEPEVRVRAARGLLAFLAKFAPDDSGYGKLIRQELALLLMTPDTYLLHEHLEEFNEPLYFHEFIDRAARKGLQYLAEAHIAAMAAGKFGEEGEKILRQISPDLLHMEQYMDFLRNRMFRQTLLCHAEVKLDHALRAEVVRNFLVSTTAKAQAPVSGASPDGREEFGGAGKPILATSDPLMKAAMHCLAEASPAPLPFEELLATARARAGSGEVESEAANRLAARLLNCYLAGVLDFSVSEPTCTGEVSERPVASPYARLRARDGGKVVNLRLETVALSTPSRLVLQHLDGQLDRAALVEMVANWLRSGAVAGDGVTNLPGPDQPLEARAAAYVDTLLRSFARGALLIA